MTAEAPPDEVRLIDPERFDDRPNRAGVARKRIRAGVLRVSRFAVTRQIDRNQAKPPPEQPLELPREGARRR